MRIGFFSTPIDSSVDLHRPGRLTSTLSEPHRMTGRLRPWRRHPASRYEPDEQEPLRGPTKPPARSAPTPTATPRLGSLDVFLLSVWCGLAAGWLEVATRVFCKKMGVAQPLYLMSRHFLWLGPFSNLLLFSGLGMGLAALTRVWPRFGGFVSPRLVCALALLPVSLIAGQFIYVEAWFLLFLGLASRLVPALERRPAPLRES